MLWFRVRVAGPSGPRGRRARGTERDRGRLPDHRARCATLEAELNVDPPAPYDGYPHPINLNVGMIPGGDWPSTVAGESVTHFAWRSIPGTASG